MTNGENGEVVDGENDDAIFDTVQKVEKSLGIGTTKCYELINSGELEAVRLGRRRLITRASVKRLARRLLDEARKGAAPR